MHSSLTHRQQRLRFFTDAEAWNLFRLAAFAEAIGWTLLGSGIMIVRYLTPSNNDVVQIAGQIHGVFFVAYFIASLALASSLGWTRLRTIVAAAMSVLPYGTLFFEKWEALRRDQQKLKTYRRLKVYAIIAHNGQYLAVQSSDSSVWRLPGGEVTTSESSQKSLEQLVTAQLGLKPQLGALLYIREVQSIKTQQLELYFAVNNPNAYAKLNFAAVVKQVSNIDEISFVSPQTEQLQPEFLQQTKPQQPPQTPLMIYR